MSTTTQGDAAIGVLERISDGLTAFSEGVGSFLTRLFGSSNERDVRKLGYIRPPSAGDPARRHPRLAARPGQRARSSRCRPSATRSCRAVTPQFRERLANGETLDDLLPEAFAACREAGRRTKNMRHFDVQIVGGVVLHRGNIAEMVTGEGKTLVATLPAYLNALERQGRPRRHRQRLPRPPRLRVDAADLPRRSASRAGYIQTDMDPDDRRQAYDCDITYGTNSEFGFDYLRDNMKPARWGDPNYPTRATSRCQKALQLRHHRRGGQHPHRRGPHAAHHLRPGVQRRPPLRQGQRDRRPAHRAAEEGRRAVTSRSRRRSTPAT